jgi:hypothetical protein
MPRPDHALGCTAKSVSDNLSSFARTCAMPRSARVDDMRHSAAYRRPDLPMSGTSQVRRPRYPSPAPDFSQQNPKMVSYSGTSVRSRGERAPTRGLKTGGPQS